VAIAARVLGDSAEAEDVVQEALLLAEGAGELRSRRAWLCTTTYRRAVDRVRAREARARAEGSAAAQADPPGPAELAAKRDELARLRAELKGVDEPFQTALRLRYLEGLDYPELAAQTGVPQRTARGRVARGLARLRTRLRGEA